MFMSKTPENLIFIKKVAFELTHKMLSIVCIDNQPFMFYNEIFLRIQNILIKLLQIT